MSSEEEQAAAQPEPSYDEMTATVTAGWAALVLGVISLVVLTLLVDDRVELYVQVAGVAFLYGVVMPAFINLTNRVDILGQAPRVVAEPPADAHRRAVKAGCARVVVLAAVLCALLWGTQLLLGSAAWMLVPAFLLGGALSSRRAVLRMHRREQLTGQRIFLRTDAPRVPWTHQQAMSQYVMVEDPTRSTGSNSAPTG